MMIIMMLMCRSLLSRSSSGGAGVMLSFIKLVLCSFPCKIFHILHLIHILFEESIKNYMLDMERRYVVNDG